MFCSVALENTHTHAHIHFFQTVCELRFCARDRSDVPVGDGGGAPDGNRAMGRVAAGRFAFQDPVHLLSGEGGGDAVFLDPIKHHAPDRTWGETFQRIKCQVCSIQNMI